MSEMVNRKNKPGAGERFTPRQIINALTVTKGMRTLAARYLGCEYRTVVRYITLYPEVAEAEQLVREMALREVKTLIQDKVERVVNGQSWQAASWKLK